jgi:hypothetical protein
MLQKKECTPHEIGQALRGRIGIRDRCESVLRNLKVKALCFEIADHRTYYVNFRLFSLRWRQKIMSREPLGLEDRRVE